MHIMSISLRYAPPKGGWSELVVKKGSAQVSLSPEGSGTRLRYGAKANIGGKLAQVGSRLIDGVAAKTADDFFANF